MKRHLILKLLAINLVVIGFVMGVVWYTIDTLAAGYFVTLMEKYNISPKPAHAMFVSSVHRYLIWASLAAVVLSVVLSFVMMRKVLAPLTRMTAISRDIAAGNFDVRVPAVTEDEVGQLARAFNQMAESLEKIQTLRRNLMIDVAHELRTPLTNIRGYLEALNDGDHPACRPRPFPCFRMKPCGWSSSPMKCSSSRAPMRPAATSTASSPICGKRWIWPLPRLPRALTQKSIRVDIHAPKAPLTVSVDRRRLARVLRNLTDNAARYTPHTPSSSSVWSPGAKASGSRTATNAASCLRRTCLYIFERFLPR